MQRCCFFSHLEIKFSQSLLHCLLNPLTHQASVYIPLKCSDQGRQSPWFCHTQWSFFHLSRLPPWPTVVVINNLLGTRFPDFPDSSMLLFSFSLTASSSSVWPLNVVVSVDSVLGPFLFSCSLPSLGGLSRFQDLKYHPDINGSQMCAFTYTLLRRPDSYIHFDSRWRLTLSHHDLNISCLLVLW